MEHEYEVDLSNNTKLSSYDDMLSIFNQWAQFKRDIKLSTILENKRIQYDIDDITNINFQYKGIYGMLLNEKDISHLQQTWESDFTKISFKVKSMSFIINGDNIDKLTIKIKILETNSGLILKNFINHGTIIKVNQLVFNNSVKCFYVEFPTTPLAA